MYTQCPNCKTVFRVHAEQLGAARGKVRCGRCLHIFLASDYEVTLPETETTAGDTRQASLPFDAPAHAPQPAQAEQLADAIPEDAAWNMDGDAELDALLAELEGEDSEEALDSGEAFWPHDHTVHVPSHSLDMEEQEPPSEPVSPLPEPDTETPGIGIGQALTPGDESPNRLETEQEPLDTAEAGLAEEAVETAHLYTTRDEAIELDASIALGTAEDETLFEQGPVASTSAEEHVAGDSPVESTTEPAAELGETAIEEAFLPSPADESVATGTALYLTSVEDEEPLADITLPVPHEETAAQEMAFTAHAEEEAFAEDLAPITAGSAEPEAETPLPELPTGEEAEIEDTGAEPSMAAPAEFAEESELAETGEPSPALHGHEEPELIEELVDNLRREHTEESLAAQLLQPDVEGHRPLAAVLWMLGILCLFALLPLQYAHHNRDILAADPQLRPWLERLCHISDCELPPLRDTSAFNMVEHAVQSHPRFRDSLLITATLRNDAAFTQPFPVVELRMTDVNQQVVASRRFKPKEYLAGVIDTGRGIGAGDEANLMLEIQDPGREAVGFEFHFY